MPKGTTQKKQYSAQPQVHQYLHRKLAQGNIDDNGIRLNYMIR